MMNLVDHKLKIDKTRFVRTRAEFVAFFVTIRKAIGHSYHLTSTLSRLTDSEMFHVKHHTGYMESSRCRWRTRMEER